MTAATGKSHFTNIEVANRSQLLGGTRAKVGSGTEYLGAAGQFASSGTQVATAADTNETDGFSKTVAANSFSQVGDAIRAKIWGSTAATANNKTIKAYFGGTSIFSSGAVASNNKPWVLDITIIKTGANTQKAIVHGIVNGSAVIALTSLTKDEATDLILKNTMTNGTAAPSDATTEGAVVEFLPVAVAGV